MARLNPYSLKRPAPLTETKSFQDDRSPDAELTLTLCASGDYNESVRIVDAGAGLAKEWAGVPTLIPVIGEITPTETLCRNIAVLQTLQVPDDGEKPYDVMEWLCISIGMPHAFGEAVRWALEVVDRAYSGPGKNGLRAATAPSSEPPLVTA